MRVCAGAVGSLHPPCAAAASPLAGSCATQTSTASTGPARCGRRWQPPSLTEQEASTGAVEVQIGRGTKFEWRLVTVVRHGRPSACLGAGRGAVEAGVEKEAVGVDGGAGVQRVHDRLEGLGLGLANP